LPDAVPVNAPTKVVLVTLVRPVIVAGSLAVSMVPVRLAAGMLVQLVNVPLEGVPSAPPATRFPLAVPVRAPTKVVPVNVPVRVPPERGSTESRERCAAASAASIRAAPAAVEVNFLSTPD
jgi:hypothetical protein